MADLRFPADDLPDDPANAVSPRFGEALRAIAAGDDHGIDIPRRVDDAVMSAARQRLAGVRRAGSASGQAGRRGWTGRRAIGWAAMAASVALAAVLAMPRMRAGDVNRDGSVDILDAYRLARTIERGEGAHADQLRADVTRDGVIDERDVQRIAQLVVRLPEETG